MILTAVPSPPPDRSWSTVLEANYENTGVNPYTLWTDALAAVGSTTVGPDSGGEHTSNCPNPLHNGGSGDSKPSLRWRQATDGQLLFSCRAGCEGNDILESLQLTYTQLKWSRTEYLYRSDLRELVAVHVRMPQPNDKKKFWWEHPENGVLVTGRGPGWEPMLWCLPDALDASAAARLAGRKVHLVLCEGEKDVIVVSDALGQGWTTDGQSGADWAHITTTSADGASTWSRELTEQVLHIAPDHVTIVCDSDQAGVGRGAMLVDALRDADSTLQIKAINWGEQPGVKDASDAIQLYGRHWLRRANAASDTDVYLWCSFETGWLHESEAKDLDNKGTGKRALHRMTNPGRTSQRDEPVTKWPVRVDAVTVDMEGAPVGWEVDLGGGGRALLRSTDLEGGSLEKWNTRTGLFITPVRPLTSALRAYLGFHGTGVGQMTVYDHEGWVDEEHFVTRHGLLIGPEGETKSACAALNGNEGVEWHYGTQPEAEAAEHMRKLLTFRDLDESGPALAWMAAVAVRPRALQASGASFVPMLQIPGASGVGKTSFLKLATRLFGFSGNPISNVTSAGLVRTLALTTGVVWIDDFANYDDAIRDIIRGGLTGAGRTRGTTSSERGIVRDESYAALINSGEHAFDANERAMSQRSVILEFARTAQGRRSREDPEQDQYRELELMGVARDDKGKGLSQWAGTVIKGLWAAAAKVDEQGVGRGSGNGIRGQAAWEFVRYGAHVLAQWLRDSSAEQDEADLERVAHMEAAVVKVCDAQARNAARREKTGADVYLVQELVPRYLNQRRQQMDPAISVTIRKLEAEEVKKAIRDSWAKASAGQSAGEQSARAVVVLSLEDDDADDDARVPLAVAVNADALYKWASSAEGGRAGASNDERHVSSQGIAMQLRQVADKSVKHNDAGASDGSLRVRLGTMQTPRYRLITEPELLKWLCE